MIMSRAEEFEEMRIKKLKEANPVRYNYEICLVIQRKIQLIELPKLSKDEISRLKEHLEDYKGLKGDELTIKFLNMRNCFLLVWEFETREDLRAKLLPIMRYLREFKYVFDLIMESQAKKDNPLLDKAMLILDVPINKFCMLYSYILTEVDLAAINFAPIEPPSGLYEQAEPFVPPEDDVIAEPIDEPIEQDKYEEEEEDNDTSERQE